MKTILVTGGAGFIGSHLVDFLLRQGHRILVVDDLSTGSLKNVEHLLGNSQVEWIHGSVADEELVRQAIARVDTVYHLAAAVGVALIAKEPIQTIERNVAPTQHLLAEINRKHLQGTPIKVFLASTSEVYGKNPKEVWNEDDDLVFGSTTRARWSYGASKAIDEFLGLGYWRQSRLPVVIGRFFNVVGPRQTGLYGMVLPRFVRAAIHGEPLVVHDDGQQIRCFAHVGDVVRSVVALMNTEHAPGEIFNIGSDQPISILELAREVIRLTGSKSEIVFQSYQDAYDDDFEDIRRRIPNVGKLEKFIGFKPGTSLKQTIEEIAKSMS